MDILVPVGLDPGTTHVVGGISSIIPIHQLGRGIFLIYYLVLCAEKGRRRSELIIIYPAQSVYAGQSSISSTVWKW